MLINSVIRREEWTDDYEAGPLDLPLWKNLGNRHN